MSDGHDGIQDNPYPGDMPSTETSRAGAANETASAGRTIKTMADDKFDRIYQEEKVRWADLSDRLK